MMASETGRIISTIFLCLFLALPFFAFACLLVRMLYIWADSIWRLFTGKGITNYDPDMYEGPGYDPGE